MQYIRDHYLAVVVILHLRHNKTTYRTSSQIHPDA